ncbi:MAG: hypothetical protein L0Y71_16100 [Gemmataceae bacterium]|nr:hypothetical protein [Gemmataceae bacterium]
MRPRGLGQAIAEFFRDLAAFEPVPWIFVGVLVLVVAIILLWGVKIMRDKRRIDEERKERWRKNRAKPL